MNNYVISLKDEHARREHIAQQFGTQGIAFEFFDAVTPKDNTRIAKELGVDITKCNLSDGEISCLLSHLSLWQKALDERLDYVAIFEDDVYLGTQAEKFLANDDWLDENMDIVKLETFLTSVLLKNSVCVRGRTLGRLCYPHYGGAGYVLGKKCLPFLLTFTKNQNPITAVDDVLFAKVLIHLTVLQLSPALCVQGNLLEDSHLGSQLEWYRQNHHFAKQQRTLAQKIKRELSTLSNKTRLKLFGNIVPFA